MIKTISYEMGAKPNKHTLAPNEYFYNAKDGILYTIGKFGEVIGVSYPQTPQTPPTLEIGVIQISTTPTLKSGWEIWNEATIVGALVADYQDLVESGSFLVTNNNGTTFDLLGHGGRYFRPNGTLVSAGATLEDVFKSHTHYHNVIGWGGGGTSSQRGRIDTNKPKNDWAASWTSPTGDATETRPKTIGVYVKIYVGLN